MNDSRKYVQSERLADNDVCCCWTRLQGRLYCMYLWLVLYFLEAPYLTLCQDALYL